MDNREQLRKTLLQRYLSTGKIGFMKPKDDCEAIDLIETIVESYNPKPIKMNLSNLADKMREILD